VRRAIGPKLRKLLYVVFALLALLGANSGYLASITALEWLTGATYQNYFYFLMFLGHLVLGLILLAPFLVFGVIHMRNSRGRRNRRAIRVGYALFTASCGVLLTGLLLVRVEGVIDLVFRDGDEWVVVDFKTDDDIDQLLERYAPQASWYIDAATRLLGGRARAVLLSV